MHYFSNTAGSMTLTTGIGSTDTSVTVNSVTGLPLTFPYSLTLDYGNGSEEVIDVTAAAGTTLTVTRGVDGTSAQSHSAGAPIRHVVVARDLREPQQHIAAASGVHGVVGSVVGTTDAQTLEVKTFQSSANADTALTVKGKSGQTAPLLKVIDSTGATQWSTDGSTLGSDAASLRTSAGASFWGQVARLTAPLGKKALELVANTSEAAGTKVLEVFKGATSVFSVAANGDVNTSGKLTSADRLSVTGGGGSVAGGLTVTGPLSVTGSNDTNGNATVSGTLTVGAKDVVTTNTSGGKRFAFGSATVTTDASGFATVTHGAGFTPTFVATQNLSTGGGSTVITGVDTMGATTFRIHVYFVNGGAVYANSSITLTFLAVN